MQSKYKIAGNYSIRVFLYAGALILPIIFVVSCAGQNMHGLTYKKYNFPVKKDIAHNRKVDSLKKKAVSLIKYLPSSYVEDGSRDYTANLQEGLDENEIVLFPDFPVLINENGLQIRSNTSLLFGDRSGLIMKANNKGSYQMLRLYEVQNVLIYNAKLIGDRDNHLGKEGEWGMGISLKSSQNITIINPRISNCWGDGIYIGTTNKVPSKDVEIFNPHLDYNRRNGISVISVDGLLIKDGIFSNNFGTDPSAGIDFEPNNHYDVLNHIIMDSPITFNSDDGIKVTLWKLTYPDLSPVNVSINNHRDFFSNQAFYVSNIKYSEMNKPLNGNISITDPVWVGNKEGLKLNYYNKYPYAPLITFKNIKVYKTLSSMSDSLNMDEINRLKKSFLRQNRIRFEN